jgi:carbonic anhydrase
VEHLRVPLIVVLGHTGCGAVDSAWAGGEYSENLKELLKPLENVVARVRRKLPPNTDSEKAKETVIRANAISAAASILENASGVAARVRTGELMLVQAIYNIGSGEVHRLPLPAKALPR